MDIKDVQNLITEKKDKVLIPMVQSMSENFAKSFETGVEVGIEIGKGLNPNYASVWHKASEEPDENKEALIEYGSDWNDNKWYDVGYYRKSSNAFQIGIQDYIEMLKVFRYAYIEDLV